MKTAVVPRMGRVLRHVIHMTYRRRLSIVCSETERFFSGFCPNTNIHSTGYRRFTLAIYPFFAINRLENIGYRSGYGIIKVSSAA